MLKEFEPKEGDLVRVQLKGSIGYPRDYMLVIWPKKELIPERFKHWYVSNSNFVGYVYMPCTFVINLNGRYSDNGFGLSEGDKLVRPTVSDMIEISMVLREYNMRYNRKTKQLIRLNNNESNI